MRMGGNLPPAFFVILSEAKDLFIRFFVAALLRMTAQGRGLPLPKAPFRQGGPL